MKYGTSIAVIALLGLAASPGWTAGDRQVRGSGVDIDTTFRPVEHDGNMRLSPYEAASIGITDRQFARIDLDGDGQIDRAEFRKARGLDEAPQVPGRTHERFSFNELDVNNDGALQKSETAFKPELARNFALADKNGDGVLNRPEFREAVAMNAEMFGETRSAQKRQIFHSLDMDGNAVISRNEARWRPAISASFDRIDRNDNGTLDMAEFAQMTLDDLQQAGLPR